MDIVYNYLRTNWVYWFASMFIFMLSGVAAKADAHPSLQVASGGMSFYNDVKHTDWVIRYKGVPTAMDENFTKIAVAWRGQYEGNPLILIEGHQAGQCATTYRLYWGQLTGDIRQAKFIDVCNVKQIKVDIVDAMVRLNFDGKVKRVPLN